MDLRSIKILINQWAISSFEEFEEGVYSIKVDSRKQALSELFSTLKKQNAQEEDVRMILANVLRLCVPKKKIDKKKQWGWASYSATDILSAYMEHYGDPQIDVQSFVGKVFPHLKKGDPEGKKKFIDGALSGELDLGKAPAKVDAQVAQDEGTISPEDMFKPTFKPLDLEKLRLKTASDMKITRFDPDMDSVLGLEGEEDV
jgi:hypothetical protein